MTTDFLDSLISITGVDGFLFLVALLVVGVVMEIWWRLRD